jgi:hypothetical protein
MYNNEWKQFFLTSISLLGEGDFTAFKSPSWCAWTIFQRLNEDSGYWTAGLPRQSDIADTYIKDGSIWGQPFPFSELAHIIIPKRFYWEKTESGNFESGTRIQNIEKLSLELNRVGVTHRMTDIILEIKLY